MIESGKFFAQEVTGRIGQEKETKLPEKREKLYQKLEKKVEEIIKLRELADSCAHFSLNQMGESFRKAFGSIIAEVGQGAEETERLNNDLSEYRGLTQKLEHLNKEFYSLKNPQPGKSNVSGTEENTDEIQKVYQRIKELKQDPDLLFLVKTEKFLSTLFEKRRIVLNLLGIHNRGPNGFGKRLVDDLLARLPSREESMSEKREEVGGWEDRYLKEIRFDGYNVDIFLTKEALPLFQKGGLQITKAAHLSGSPFNLFFVEGLEEEERRQIVAHEHNHNLLESFLEEAKYAPEVAEEILDRIERILILLEDSDNLPNSLFAEENNLLHRAIQDYFRRGYCEVVAGIDDLAKGNIAGIILNFRKFLIIFDKIDNRLDGALGELLGWEVEETIDNFVEQAKIICRILFSAYKSDKIKEAQAALILLGPDNLKRAEGLMRRYCPNYDFYSRLSLVWGSFIKTEEVAKLFEGLNIEEPKGLVGEVEFSPKTGFSGLFYQKLKDNIMMPAAFFERGNIQELLKVAESGLLPPLTFEEKAKAQEVLSESSGLKQEDIFRVNQGLEEEDFGRFKEEIRRLFQKLGLPQPGFFQNSTR